MDTIWNCAFGLDIDCQKEANSKNIFLSQAVKHFNIVSASHLFFDILSIVLLFI